MTSFKNSLSLSLLPAAGKIAVGKTTRFLYWLCGFCLLVAGLELGQDYISSVLNGNNFDTAESLSYKLFWLLFIPFILLFTFILEKTEAALDGFSLFATVMALILTTALVHLMVFSSVLYGVSNLIHADPWTMPYLISEKLSTRLYISLFVYVAWSAFFLWAGRKETTPEPGRLKSPKTISVKNGRRSVIINTDEIQWIRSDGPYLYIHTKNKKHVVLDSLKHIITTLPESFRRIHRSVIVNIESINELKSRGNGDYDVVLENGRELRLSRNYTKPLKGILL